MGNVGCWYLYRPMKQKDYSSILKNTLQNIADLKTLVGTLPEGVTSTTVVAYITEAINALSIGDYAKTTEVTAAISTALESYYTKTQVDETFVKKTDIVMATDEEVDAMLTEVFGAQATV